MSSLLSTREKRSYKIGKKTIAVMIHVSENMGYFYDKEQRLSHDSKYEKKEKFILLLHSHLIILGEDGKKSLKQEVAKQTQQT